MRKPIATLEITAGSLLRGEIRRELDKIVYRHPEISYREFKGFLSSDFIIRGPLAHVGRIKRWLEEVGN